MIDLYLRAGNAGAMANACPFLRTEDPETGERQWLTGTPDFALVVIGPLVVEPATYDEEGNELTPPVVDDRFHMNLRCTEGVAAMVPSTVIIEPTHPMQAWFGAPPELPRAELDTPPA